MFFINRGTVEVVSEDGEVVFAKMNEGKFFGEISLVFSCPRTASIRSESLPIPKIEIHPSCIIVHVHAQASSEKTAYGLKFSIFCFT